MKLKRTSAGLVTVNLFSATLLSLAAIGDATAWAWISLGGHMAMLLLWLGVWIGEADSAP
jgi:hypothetical protein